ncbi:Pc16g14470 [Penicillium rubens Wisconsin 54-1255]|uniref:Pc16g14470 protein n=1 Tax=Penicillium rubens (strain ATCC 28089 / DSM 1075 / NRRL 1951 / Wisconsin 54-1255) TaxID=500485 RepID=B6H9Z3_PENRW|nr:Pc16g14470 [Penicillium rubens Wisconsin 54-1255]
MTLLSARRVTGRVWTSADCYSFALLRRARCYSTESVPPGQSTFRKQPQFRDYFVTHLPSSSLHPDPRGPSSPFHKLPRSASIPHTGDTPRSPAAFQALTDRETTVVRIPLRNAKHHFGAVTSRGTRPSNEDTYQAGVIDIPAFAKRAPTSVTIRRSNKHDPLAHPRESRGAETASGDPQVFYFGVFDGHGGSECSSELPVLQEGDRRRIGDLEKYLVQTWRRVVGGYFKRFKPPHFAYTGTESTDPGVENHISIEEVVEYAFLRADLDFVNAQAAKRDDDPVRAERPLNEDEIFHRPSMTRSPQIGGSARFKGGSTGSVAMISTPTPTPFWHPVAPSSLLVAHVGDTRMLLCSTETGDAIPITSNHHPSSPIEASRLRRYATTFVTDSFGEERMSGLANTRAFGDVQSKRIGVSAEPELKRIELGPAEFSFLVLVSDGISGTLLDQEIVDIVKESKTPEEGARDVVNFSTEVTREGDNATCLVVRLGGWERRLEGGVGSMGTKESREWRRQDATDPRRSRT